MLRVRLLLSVLAAAVAAAAVLAPIPGAPTPTLAADDTATPAAMTAADPATWKALLDEKSLEELVEAQQKEIEGYTKASSLFSRGFRKLTRNAYYAAVLGNAGTMVLEGDEAKKKAAALRDAALEVMHAATDKEYEKAKEAAAVVADWPRKIAPAGSAEPMAFMEMTDLHELMEGVNSLFSAASKPVQARGSRMRGAKEGAQAAKLLACLSVISRDYEEEADWKGWCDLMRKESVAMAEALDKNNKDDAEAARNRNLKSCDQCHDVYREEQ